MRARIARNKCLLGTAALLAGISFASAQGMKEGAGGSERGMSSGSSGAQTSHGSPAASRGEAMPSQSRGAGESRAQGLKEGGGRAENEGVRHMDRGQAGRGEMNRDRTVGQAQHRESDQLRRSEGAQSGMQKGKQAQQPMKESQTTGSATHGKSDALNRKQTGTEAKKAQTTGSATHGKSDALTQKQTGTDAGKGQTTGSAAQSKTDANAQKQSGTRAPEGQTTGAATQSKSGTTTQGQTGTAAQTQASRTQLSEQQQTTIQRSVLSARNAPRVNVNSINFAINTGVVVPSRVRFASVTAFPALIDAFPEYRDDSFFVVEDEIVFLDRSRRIVDVVPVGPRARFSRRGGSAAVAVDLSEPEIREVQEVLIRRGLLHGRVTGVFDDRTREALITFQRREGFQASGSIDTRTVSALGLSGKIRGNSQSTVGQGRTGNESTVGQGSGQPSQSRSGDQQQQPSAQHNTNGQAAPQNQSTVGQSRNQPSSAKSSGSAPSSSPGTQSPAPSTSNQSPSSSK